MKPSQGFIVDDREYLLDTVDAGRTRLATAAEIEQRLSGATAPVILCGHSHLPRAVRTATGQLLVNPGSVGLPAFDDGNPSYHVIETGSPDARYAVLERRSSAWAVSLLSVPYDFEPMANLAEENARPEWAHALRTGYVRAQPEQSEAYVASKVEKNVVDEICAGQQNRIPAEG
jgi:hypothetical protein